MEKVNSIIRHPLWLSEMEKIRVKERDRKFCRHGMDHLLHVARISYIESLEKNYGIDKEVIYAAALLHDIGRGREYADGVPHEEEGARIAGEILKDCGFNEEEIKSVLEAIRAHRKGYEKSRNVLGDLIYRADKKSRNCFLCKARTECNRREEERNSGIER